MDVGTISLVLLVGMLVLLAIGMPLAPRASWRCSCC